MTYLIVYLCIGMAYMSCGLKMIWEDKELRPRDGYDWAALVALLSFAVAAWPCCIVMEIKEYLDYMKKKG